MDEKVSINYIKKVKNTSDIKKVKNIEKSNNII